jgi:uncharacterized protein YkwD
MKLFFLFFILVKIISGRWNKKRIKRNWKRFCKQEKKEAQKIGAGEVSFKKYCYRSASVFYEYFIPHSSNQYKPKILRTDTLIVFAVLLIFVKIFVVASSFFVYSDLGRMEQRAEYRAVHLINQVRSDNGIPPLNMNKYLNECAEQKALDMLKKGYFSHTTPEGEKPWDIIDRNKYPYLYVGENLGRDFSSISIVHDALMSSPGHKKNILNKIYTDVGVAVISGNINGQDTKVLVQLFGAASSREKQKVAENKEPKDHLKTVSDLNSINNEKEGDELTFEEQERIKQTIDQENLVAEREKSTTSESIVNNSNVLPVDSVLAVGPKQEDSVDTSPIMMPADQVPLNNTVNYFSYRQNNKVARMVFLLDWSDYLFYIILVLLFILLAVNVLIKITIQHKPIILQTIFLLIFIYSLIQIKFDFIQGVMGTVITL